MMRVLLVCSFKDGFERNMAPFVREQMDTLKSHDVVCECFLVKGKGASGYLGNLKALKRHIASFHPDVIHAHYGLCGILANMQRQVPVVTTYHGSDVFVRTNRIFSQRSMRLSKWNIFVSEKMLDVVHPNEHDVLIPCGVDLTDLQLTGKLEARQIMHLDEKKHFVLFPASFDNPVKDAQLAKDAVSLLHEEHVELLELKGYSREEVTLLMCAADAMLMTSLSEGSPQVVKEALACGCPIVTVDVGDVRERTAGVDGCYVAQTREPQEVALLLQKALDFERKTEGRKKITEDGLTNDQIAEKLIKIYKSILK